MNRDDTLAQCIASLRAEQVADIIVVDNGNGPDVSGVVYIRSPENLGPAGGYALGISAALKRGHEVLWLFNDDDEALPGSHQRLLTELAQPGVGAVGSRVMFGDTIRSRGQIWRGRGIQPDWQSSSVLVDVTTFSGLMLSAEAARRAGVPRSDLFMMFEEHEYCLRIRSAGMLIKILFDPQSRTLALGSTSGASWREYYRARNHLRVALDRGSLAEVAWWGVRQLRLAIASRRANVGSHLRFAARGALDACRGKMGRTVQPGSAT
jgi:rhamnopyranosyl-N-acetylglucosaminyl-diphospho-decaprenol beta-1,3/1,4-galactofuranosyltransferase